MALAQAAAPIATVARGDVSQIEDAKEAVAQTATEWAVLWKSHAGSEPLPAVDFSQRMVVAVFLGARPTAGYGVELKATRIENGVLVVEYIERRPGAGDIAAQILTSPYQIATVPRHAGAVRFQRVPPG